MRHQKWTWSLEVGAKVRVENWDVESRLSQIGFTRHELLDVVDVIVAHASNVSENDPPIALGNDCYRWGVRTLRDIKRMQGWDKDDTGNYCTLLHHERKIRIAVVNSDDNTGRTDPDAVPQNRSRKGAKSEEVSRTNELFQRQGHFSGDDWAPPQEASNDQEFDDYTTWHLCVYVVSLPGGDMIVRAEMSRLGGFTSGYFTECFEKIILLGVGDWKKPDFRGNDDLGPDFVVEVTRK